jgi:TonB family protein
MKLDINRYIRYCLFLFDSCTVNGLGTFQIVQSPPKLDHNGNYVNEEKYTISFTEGHSEKPRLSYLLCSKENCTEQDAENSIKNYVKSVFEEIGNKNEVWFRELGMLIKKNGELRFLSHKFTAKELKQQVTAQTSLPLTNPQLNTGPVFNISEEMPVYATNEIIKAVDIVEENDLQFTNFSTQAAPVIPFAKKIEKRQPAEEVAAAVFMAAVPHNNDNTLVNAQHGGIKKNIFGLSAKVKKNIIYGLSITGCVAVSYFLYSFLVTNKNLQAKNYTLPASNTKQENGTKNLITEGTKNDNEVIYGKNAVYTMPNTVVKENNITAANSLKDKKKETEINKPPTETAVPPATEVVNDRYVTGKNTFIEKEMNTGETNNTIPENKEAQLKPAIKIDIPAANEKNIAETKTEIVTDAEFPGGKNKFANFLRQKLIYPESSIEDAKEGVSFVKIIIDKNGNIKSTQILNSLGSDFDQEIKRVVGRMPQWVPAKKNGEAVESTFSFKVNFRNDNKLQQK